MSDESDIEDAVVSDAISGAEEIQNGDRRIRQMDPLKRLDVADRVAARASTRSPFMKIGFR